jgi:hypothetical protein
MGWIIQKNVNFQMTTLENRQNKLNDKVLKVLNNTIFEHLMIN